MVAYLTNTQEFLVFFVQEVLLTTFCVLSLSTQIRNAWDNKKSMARNLQEMGLAFDPNRTVPIAKSRVSGCCGSDPSSL